MSQHSPFSICIYKRHSSLFFFSSFLFSIPNAKKFIFYIYINSKHPFLQTHSLSLSKITQTQNLFGELPASLLLLENPLFNFPAETFSLVSSSSPVLALPYLLGLNPLVPLEGLAVSSLLSSGLLFCIFLKIATLWSWDVGFLKLELYPFFFDSKRRFFLLAAKPEREPSLVSCWVFLRPWFKSKELLCEPEVRVSTLPWSSGLPRSR